MPRHVREMFDSIESRFRIDSPILSYSYVKLDPIPDKWNHLLELDPDDIDTDDDINTITDVADALARSIEKNRGSNESAVRHKVIVREGSLEIICVLITCLCTIFQKEIKENIVKAYKNKNLTSEKAREVIGQMIHQATVLLKRTKYHTQTLKQVTLDVFDLDGNNHNNIAKAEGRNGVLLALCNFHDTFSSAKNKSRNIKDRVSSLKSAHGYLLDLTHMLSEREDKLLIHMYLDIRVRDSNLLIDDSQNRDEEMYNSIMKEICKISDSLKGSADSEF